MSYPGQDNAYERITWQNYPSVATPIDEINLNKMDARIKKVDDTLTTWDGDGTSGKVNRSELGDVANDVNISVGTASESDPSHKAIEYDSSTGTFTIRLNNGTSYTINTDIEKIAINFDYDDDPTSAHYQNLVIELDDGTYKYIDMSALITEYEFGNSSTIAFTVDNDGAVTAGVINGSITGEKLQPNYLSDVTAQAGAASASALSAGTSASDSEAYAVGTRNGTAVPSTDPTYHNNAKYYAQQMSPPTILTQTLAASGTTVTFTGLPTSGSYMIDFFIEGGANYTAINTATAGQVTLTYAAESSARAVYCKIEEVR